MPRSPFFARIKTDVLRLAAAIPKGKVSSYSSIGEHLDVMPRHVAYILATLDPEEQLQFPWHRVVGNDGSLGKLKRAESGETQADLLKADGVLVMDNSVAHCFEKVFVSAGALRSGVKKQVRPLDAPVPKARKARLGGK